MNSLSEPTCKRSKRASSLKFLVTTVINKYFKNYYVERISKIMSWKDIYNSNDCFHSIMICIIKDSSFSRDHMIAIANGWIFDSNLHYALPLNEDSLNWCASHGKEGYCFDKFVEHVQVGRITPGKEKNKKQKKNTST